MCLNLNIKFNQLNKAALNHEVLFDKNSNALLKLYPIDNGKQKMRI